MATVSCVRDLTVQRHFRLSRKQEEVLLRSIDLQHGLELELVSKKVITHEELEDIEARAGSNQTKEVKLLLKLLKRRHDVNVYKRFLLVLRSNETHQHVYNYLMRAQGEEVDRPLTADEVNRIDRCVDRLAKGVYPGDEFLAHLIQRGVISTEHLASIDEQGKNSYKRCKLLLRILRRRGINSLMNFEDALRDANLDDLADKLCIEVGPLEVVLDLVCPLEVVELVLFLSVVKWDLERWQLTRLMELHRDVETFTTMCGVCSEWTYILRSQRFLRGLQRYNRTRCYPYRSRVKRLQQIYLNECVTGVAQLDNRLYVTVCDSDLVRVYDCSTTDYTALEPIRAKNLKNPWDLAACSLHHRIYITDCSLDRGGVYYIEIQPNDVDRCSTVTKYTQSRISPSLFSNGHVNTDANVRRNERARNYSVLNQGWLIKKGDVENPRGISVSSVNGNVIVVSWAVDGHSMLLIIDPMATNENDRVIIKRITLPAHIDIPHHAIETPEGMFVVAHGRGEETLHQVCLISCDGVVLKSFGGKMLPVSNLTSTPHDKPDDFKPLKEDEKFVILADEDIGPDAEESFDEYRHLNSPYALAIDFMEKSPLGGTVLTRTVDQMWTIIVADYGGRRILVLDSELHLKRTLLTNETNQIDEPRQVWIDSASGRLYVGQDTGLVDVFSVRDQSKQL